MNEININFAVLHTASAFFTHRGHRVEVTFTYENMHTSQFSPHEDGSWYGYFEFCLPQLTHVVNCPSPTEYLTAEDADQLANEIGPLGDPRQPMKPALTANAKHLIAKFLDNFLTKNGVSAIA